MYSQIAESRTGHFSPFFIPNYRLLSVFVMLFIMWMAGISLTLVEIAGVAGVISAGILSDRFGRKKVLLLYLVGAPLMLIGFVWMGVWVRFGFLIVTGFLLLSTTPVILAIVRENSKTSLSTANGIFTMTSFMARSAVTVIVGILLDIMCLKATFTLSACLGLIAIPFILMLPENKKSGSSPH